MKTRDFLILMLVCLVWALNLVVSHVVLVTMGVPPFYYAAVRFLLVAIMLAPLLRPVPPQFGWIVLISFLIGAGHFGFLFLGLSLASPSSSSIVLQLGVPITAILSIFMLGEEISLARAAGILLSVLGVLAVMWDPRGFEASYGLIFILAATTAISFGGILLKRIFRIKPLRLQAWVSLLSFGPLGLVSLFFEHGQIETSLNAGWILVGGLVFSAVIVTGWSHTTWYGLLQRYEANFISPLTLAMPLMTIGLGVTLTGDHFDLRMAIGTIVAIAGILIVIKAPGRAMTVVEPDAVIETAEA